MTSIVVDASIVVRWMVEGPHWTGCQVLLDRCQQIDARLLAPTCLYSEVANALHRLCLAPLTPPPLLPDEAIALLRGMPALDIALVDHVARTPNGDVAFDASRTN